MEFWVPTKHAGYEAGDLGHVLSLKTGRVLSTYPNPPYGHFVVSFWVDGKAIKQLLHDVILESFVALRPPGMFGLHWDDDVTNNALSNLRWDTPTANNLDAVRNGRNVNSNKERCPTGHEYTEANTWWYKGWRYCRVCRRDRTRERKLVMRQQIRGGVGGTGSNLMVTVPKPGS